MTFFRPVALTLFALAGCQQIPKDVDTAPVEDPRDRGDLAVEYQICFPDRQIEIGVVDVDVSSYLKALDEMQAKMPTEHRNTTLKDGLPPMSASRHMEVRYAGASLTEVNMPWYPSEEIEHSKEGVISAGRALGGYLRDVTMAKQPVFSYSEERFDDITAIGVRADVPPQQFVKYWFIPPVASLVPASRFTEWAPPVSMENRHWAEEHMNWSPTSWDSKALGRGFPITGNTAVLPKIRYRLITRYEFNGFDSSWAALKRWLPSLIAQQYSTDVKASAGGELMFVRPHEENVQACD